VNLVIYIETNFIGIEQYFLAVKKLDFD